MENRQQGSEFLVEHFDFIMTATIILFLAMLLIQFFAAVRHFSQSHFIIAVVAEQDGYGFQRSFAIMKMHRQSYLGEQDE